MRHPTPPAPVDRRTFLHRVSGLGAAMAALYAGRAYASPESGVDTAAAAWRDQIGLQLFTVRDRTAADYPGALLDVARIGYKQVQTTGSYGSYTAQQMKEFLDRAGLVAPTTHVSPPAGVDFERTLDDYRLIGHRYTTVNVGEARRGPRPPGAAPSAGAPPAGAPPAGGPPAQRPPAPPQTLDAVKRTAEQLNEAGRVTQRHGIKVIVHNHTAEFAPLADSSQRPYDVLLAETDPSLVAMELDIGWAAVAGQDALSLFRQAPGRFEVWHVKDVAGLAALNGLTQAERQRAARIVPLGAGEIDYRPIFAQAALAGMKYFYVEQDSAPQSGDSMAAAAASYQALLRVLS